MQTRIVLLSSLLLTACGHLGTQWEPGAKIVSPEFREAGEETRKQLGIGPDELLIAVRPDGKVILYKAPGKEFVRDDKGSGTTVVKLLVIPSTDTTECYDFWLGGAHYWFPKPPCPITK